MKQLKKEYPVVLSQDMDLIEAQFTEYYDLAKSTSLMLIRVRGQTLLLGVTPQSVNCLTEIHEMEGEWAQPSDDEGRARPRDEYPTGNGDRR